MNINETLFATQLLRIQIEELKKNNQNNTQ